MALEILPPLDYVNQMTVGMVTSFKEDFGWYSDLMMKSKYVHIRPESESKQHSYVSISCSFVAQIHGHCQSDGSH